MPSEDVSDLRDVVDAINRLCETMKTSNYEDNEQELIEPEDVVVRQVETFVAENWSDSAAEEVSDMEQLVTVCEPVSEYYTASSEVSLLSDENVQVTIDTDKAVNYASSEVSLLSDENCQVTIDTDKAVTYASEVFLQSDELAQFGNEDLEQRDDRNSVMAGHVAAMRERFESMTRTNTPCPELMRSASPSFDIFRNITPSPDQLDKS